MFRKLKPYSLKRVITFLFGMLIYGSVNAQLQKVVFHESLDTVRTIEFVLNDLPAGTDSIEIGLISQSHTKYLFSSRIRYHHSEEQLYSFDGFDSLRIDRNDKTLYYSYVYHLSCFDSLNKAILEQFYVYNHYSPSAGVLKFTMPWVKFANDSHDELYKLCGEHRPDGIWELGVKNQKTYQRGPKEYGEIQTFNSYLFLDEDEMEELNYQVVAWNHNGNPFERDELLFEEDASLAVQKDVPTKVPFYHHLLADTVALDFLVSDLIPIGTKTEYTHPKVEEFKLQNYKDTIWNGMFVRMFTLNVKHDLPYGTVSIRRYPFRSNTRLIYKDSLSGKPNIALDSGETTCQFIELIPRDFESEAYFKLIQKSYDCANPIKANFPSIDSSALYNLKVVGSKKYKNDSYVLLGDHLNPSMSQAERKKLPQHKIEKTSPYSYLRAGWEGKLYEEESITLYINSSKGIVSWSGVPQFNKKGKCTLKLMSEEGKKVKIKMIVLEDLE